MKISKLSGSLVAATLIIGLNTVATADDRMSCGEVIEDTEALATYLRCDPDGTWPDAAIWKWKGKATNGCAIHLKLARQLDEKREDYDAETMPPYKGAKNRNGNNTAAGAANDLRNGKFDSAILHYQTFMDTIVEYNLAGNKLNEDYGKTSAEFDSAEDAAEFFRSEAEHLQMDAIAYCAP